MLRSHVEAWDPMGLAGRRVLVVGAGVSGVAAADFLLRRGARVTVTDRRTVEELGERAADLSRWGARLAMGGHPARLFDQAELIILSPGVDPQLGPLAAARARGVEIASEVELAIRHLRSPLVAITGTNGKSTTTTFTGQLLRGSGKRAFVGGNLGVPLVQAVDGDHDVVVAELSSFQLEAAPSLRPHVSILLNITEDHLDRYPSFEDYARTKGAILTQQRPSGVAIVNADDPRTVALAEGSPAEVWTFSRSGPVERGAWLEGDRIHYGHSGAWRSLDLSEFTPRGVHNRENLMAAALAAQVMGVCPDQMQRGVGGLEGLSHRMEWVDEQGGVRWYNDSKATNVASVIASISGLGEPLVVLLGGKDKGGSYAPLARLMAEKGSQAVVFGQAAPQIAAALHGKVPYDRAQTLAEAVELAAQRAAPGSSVVLSPACSSYDQFTDYRERGVTFRQLVRARRASEEGR